MDAERERTIVHEAAHQTMATLCGVESSVKFLPGHGITTVELSTPGRHALIAVSGMVGEFLYFGNCDDYEGGDNAGFENIDHEDVEYLVAQAMKLLLASQEIWNYYIEQGAIACRTSI